MNVIRVVSMGPELAGWVGYLLCACIAVQMLFFSQPAAGADAQASPADRGLYLARLGGCIACHTSKDGEPLAGGHALTSDFGTFYTPNITSDRDTGIGDWSLQDFVTAMREGVSPDGDHYYPAFPYTAYTRLSDADLDDLWAYLQSVPPVRAGVPEHELPWYLFRPLVRGWKFLYFEPARFEPDPALDDSANRGAYLAGALAHCDECHGPRDSLGGLDPAMRYAGTQSGPDGKKVPNITPHRDTGIGRWSRDDLGYYFETGATPDGDYAGGLMAEVIDDGLGFATEADRLALADYLRSLPPIDHQVGKPKEKKTRKKRDEFDY